MGLTRETNDASARKWKVQDEPSTLYCSRKQKRAQKIMGHVQDTEAGLKSL